MTKMTMSKCLTVFVAAASLAYLGIAAVSTAGGPNWEAKLNELPEYTFQQSQGETPIWSVKTRMSGEDVRSRGDFRKLPTAIVAARGHWKARQQKRIDELQSVQRRDQAKLTEAKQLIEVDLQAIENRFSQMAAELVDLQREIAEKVDEGIRLAEATQVVQADTNKRREEVFRLQRELEEIRTDKFRVLALERKLRDRLVLLESNIDRLERRNRQLKKPYEE